jgi:GDP-mannose transporter
MVGSSVIAAWADISSTLSSLADIAVVDPTSGAEVPLPSGVIGSLNAGYLWMAVNCLASAAYVRLSPPCHLRFSVDSANDQVLFMRKRIKVTGFKDWDSMFYNNLLSIPVLITFSLLAEDWSLASFSRNLYVISPSTLLCGSLGSEANRQPRRE